MTAVERPTCGTAPVPLRATVCGLVGALSEMLSVAVRDPVAAGVKVTLTWHDAFWARDVQLLVWLKSPAFGPPIETEVMLSEAEPVLVTVTDWALLWTL